MGWLRKPPENARKRRKTESILGSGGRGVPIQLSCQNAASGLELTQERENDKIAFVVSRVCARLRVLQGLSALSCLRTLAFSRSARFLFSRFSRFVFSRVRRFCIFPVSLCFRFFVLLCFFLRFRGRASTVCVCVLMSVPVSVSVCARAWLCVCVPLSNKLSRSLRSRQKLKLGNIPATPHLCRVQARTWKHSSYPPTSAASTGKPAAACNA